MRSFKDRIKKLEEGIDDMDEGCREIRIIRYLETATSGPPGRLVKCPGIRGVYLLSVPFDVPPESGAAAAAPRAPMDRDCGYAAVEK